MCPKVGYSSGVPQSGLQQRHQADGCEEGTTKIIDPTGRGDVTAGLSQFRSPGLSATKTGELTGQFTMRGARHQHGDLAFDLGIGGSLQRSDERLIMEGPLVVCTSNQRKLPSANSLNIRFFQKVMFFRLWRMPLQPAVQTMKSCTGRNTRIGLRLGLYRLRHAQIGRVNRCYFCSC